MRILLDLQAGITSLENKLDQIDRDDAQTRPSALNSRSRDVRLPIQKDGSTGERQPVLRELRIKLLKYGEAAPLTVIWSDTDSYLDELLAKAYQNTSLPQPLELDCRKMESWFANVLPLVEKETFLSFADDLVILRPGR